VYGPLLAYALWPPGLALAVFGGAWVLHGMRIWSKARNAGSA
jgi:hypothetical protein